MPTVLQLSLSLLEEAQLPSRFTSLDIESYKGRKGALDTVVRYTKSLEANRCNGLGLLFRGPRNSYKSFLSCYILCFAASMRPDYRIRYFSFSDIVDGVLKNELRFSDLSKPDFLVVDNLLRETNSFWTTAMQRLLVARRDAGKPTIFCTRLDDNELIATYGQDNVVAMHEMTTEVVTHADSRHSEERAVLIRRHLNEEIS